MHFFNDSIIEIFSLNFLWKSMFWSSFAALVYTYVGYPMLLRSIAFFCNQTKPKASIAPYLTVLICAHNEADHIESKLKNTLALNYPVGKLQIIVASDGSTDETDEIVRSFATRGVELVQIPQQSGKTYTQNIAMQSATGEVVVFSDATTRYHPEALQYLAGNFSDLKVGAVSGRYVYFDPTHKSPTGSGAKAYAGYDNDIREMQSRISSITGCCGCIYAVRRRLYTSLEADIISDLVEPLHVLLKGYKVKLEPRAVAWERSTVSSKKEFSMRVRVIARALIGLSSVSSLLNPLRHPWLAAQLYSHKIMRWCVPLFLFGTLISCAALHANPFFAAALVLQLTIYSIALLAAAVSLHKKVRFLDILQYFCVVNAAAVAGIVQYLRGKKYTAWRPDREVSHAR